VHANNEDCTDVDSDGFLIMEPIVTYFNPKKVNLFIVFIIYKILDIVIVTKILKCTALFLDLN